MVASGSHETCGNPSLSPLRVPCPWPSSGRKVLPRSLVALAAAVPSGLRGRPRPPRLLSSRSLRLRLSQPGSAPSQENGWGTVEAAEEPAPPGARGNTTGETSRGQHGVAGASSASQARGRQAARREVPSLEQGRVRPDMDCIKVRKRPTITRTNSSWRGLQTVLGQSGSAVQVAKGGFLNGRDQGIDFRFWLAHWEPQVFTPVTY